MPIHRHTDGERLIVVGRPTVQPDLLKLPADIVGSEPLVVRAGAAAVQAVGGKHREVFEDRRLTQLRRYAGSRRERPGAFAGQRVARGIGQRGRDPGRVRRDETERALRREDHGLLIQAQ